MASLIGIAQKVANTGLSVSGAKPSTFHSSSILGRLLGVAPKEGQKSLTRTILGSIVSPSLSLSGASKGSLLGRVNSRLEAAGTPTPPIVTITVDSARRISAPDGSSLAGQTQQIEIKIDSLAKGLKKQQDQLQDQAVKNENAIKESRLESNAADRLTPANDNSNGLADSLRALNVKIAELAAGGKSLLGSALSGLFGTFGELLSLGRGAKTAGAVGEVAADAVKLNKGFRAEETAAGLTRYRDLATGRFVKKDVAVAKPFLTKAADATKSFLKPIAKATGLAEASNKVKVGAGLIKAATPDVIKKLAAPLAEKAVGKTVLKSIPLVGAAAGVGMALMRLADGDVVGAGLDAASGLAGPMTAIPALIFSLARDLYTEVYGVHPETDPMVGERMGIVKQGVTLAVTDAMRPAVHVSKPNPVANAQATTPPKIVNTDPKKQTKPDNTAGLDAKPVSAPPAPTPTPTTPPSDNSGSGSSNTGPKGSPAAAAGSKPIKAADGKAVPTPQVQSIFTAPKPLKPTGGAGSNMAAASQRNDAMASKPTEQQDNTIIVQAPSRKPTSRPYSTGVGNVPDPNYFDIGMFADQMYFSGAM